MPLLFSLAGLLRPARGPKLRPASPQHQVLFISSHNIDKVKSFICLA